MRRAGDQVAGGGIFDEEIDKEQRRRFHGRIGASLEKLPVAREQVMLPEMMTQPGATRGPDAVHVVDGRGAAPVVGVVMSDPPAAAILFPGGARAADDQVVDQVEQRFVAFAQAGQLRRPVIHLELMLMVYLLSHGG